MKENQYSLASITLSILCLLIILKVNIDIATAYKIADGKTRALFGIIELTYSYKYYFLFLSIISIVLALISNKRKELKTITRIAIFTSIISIVFVFFRIWKLMI